MTADKGGPGGLRSNLQDVLLAHLQKPIRLVSLNFAEITSNAATFSQLLTHWPVSKACLCTHEPRPCCEWQKLDAKWLSETKC